MLNPETSDVRRGDRPDAVASQKYRDYKKERPFCATPFAIAEGNRAFARFP